MIGGRRSKHFSNKNITHKIYYRIECLCGQMNSFTIGNNWHYLLWSALMKNNYFQSRRYCQWIQCMVNNCSLTRFLVKRFIYYIDHLFHSNDDFVSNKFYMNNAFIFKTQMRSSKGLKMSQKRQSIRFLVNLPYRTTWQRRASHSKVWTGFNHWLLTSKKYFKLSQFDPFNSATLVQREKKFPNRIERWESNPDGFLV